VLLLLPLLFTFTFFLFTFYFRSYPVHRLALTLLLFVSLVALSGCSPFEKAQLFADTYTDQISGFSLHSPQWAADGETVTFDFAPDTSADYAVFNWSDGKTTFVDRSMKKDAFFRATHVFAAGSEQRTYEVSAVAYMIRGLCDWYLDDLTHEWTLHRPIQDPEDAAIGHAKMTVICYRPEVDLTFTPPSGKTAKSLVLTMIKNDGARTDHRAKTADSPGFTQIGPDQRGQYHLHYDPAAKEINRTGETAVELLATYNDGTQELIKHKIKTP
jgi:hypothetical protein